MTVAACTPQQAERREAAQPAPEAAQGAWELRQQGQLEAAAQEFVRLARQSRPPQSHTFLLHAAQSYLDADKGEAAAKILDEISLPKDQGDLGAWARILTAQIALRAGQHDLALASLDEAEALDRDGARLRQVRELRALAFSQMNQPLAAVNERVALEPLLGDLAEIEANRSAIWTEVLKVPDTDLQTQLAAAPPTLRGWMELALIARRSGNDAAAFAARLEQWKRSYPQHGGASVAAPGVPAAGAAAVPGAPRRIALILPEEAQFAAAGAAVRDGFVTAWYGDSVNPARPAVSIYTATASAIDQVYDSAVAEGAEIVVGPLDRPSVDTLARRPALSVPVLSLNQSSGAVASAGTLFQFGLLPEDEARQIAERAWFDGRQRALVITPIDAWGDRVFQAFKGHWETLGGEVIERAVFVPESRDFATPVKELLNVDESEARVAALKKLLGRDLQAEPRRRQDVDFVFMAAFPLQARQIRPQLQFYRAEALPTYATSHVYVGEADSQRDIDLDGVIFGDMPWLLRQGGSNATRDLIRRKWPDEAAAYGRLHALGVDAYRVIPYLNQLHTQRTMRVDGETGTLTMTEQGQIARQLTWARFSGGVPVLLDQTQNAATP